MANTALKAKDRIENEMMDNPLFKDVTHISIGVDTSGFLFWKKSNLNVIGRVNTEKEFKDLNKLIESETEGIKVINSLRVENRS